MNLKTDGGCLIVLWFIMALQMSLGVCLECYSCTNVSHVALCGTVVTCPAGQICHKTFTAGAYRLGCKARDSCNVVSTGSGGAGSIVGRAVTPLRHSVRSSGDCSECCETGMCNRQLCQTNDAGCHDSGHVDCQSTGAFLDLCSEMGHSKSECRKFCGLCSLVDGAWSVWSSWSVCSTTCDNGTETRARTCANPAPADGGANCGGANHETRVCSHEPCNVDGGWSAWSSWRPCAVTCGVGLQNRVRTCSNPLPVRSGRNCLGDATEVKICIPRACQDGSWSTWGAWTSCSATCGVCTQTRHRSCTGQAVGRVCVGDNMGVTTRLFKSCNEIGFTVYNPVGTAEGHVTFSGVVTNLGGGYNTTSGEFTCKVSGVYTFSVSLLKKSEYSSLQCAIYKDSTEIGMAHVNPQKAGGYFPATTTVYVHLAAGEKISLQGCSSVATMYDGFLSSFSGHIVQSD